jgi:hypothetical protein
MDWVGERERDRRGMTRGEVGERMMTVDGPEALVSFQSKPTTNQAKLENEKFQGMCQPRTIATGGWIPVPSLSWGSFWSDRDRL